MAWILAYKHDFFGNPLDGTILQDLVEAIRAGNRVRIYQDGRNADGLGYEEVFDITSSRILTSLVHGTKQTIVSAYFVLDWAIDDKADATDDSSGKEVLRFQLSKPMRKLIHVFNTSGWHSYAELDYDGHPLQGPTGLHNFHGQWLVEQ